MYKKQSRTFSSVYLLLFIIALSVPVVLYGQKVSEKYSTLYARQLNSQTFYKGDVNLKIDVDLQNASLLQALRQISRRANLKLTYRADFMTDTKITFHATQIQVNKVLERVLKDVPLDYIFTKDRHLIILPKPQKLVAPAQATVSGAVKNATSGNVMPGVNISIKGTAQGTSTDKDGHYRLEVPSLQDTLIFTFIGFKRQTVPIAGRTTINVSLQTKVLQQKALIVVGYGTQEKQNVTGAISSINSDQISDQPVSNLQDALQGKSSGIQITQNSGQPGSTANVRIRGLTSINSSNPLYVVDGTPLGLQQY